MARLFTLTVEFRSKEYVALVSLRQQANELYCLVRYVDSGLQYLMPGDDLIFNLDGKLTAPENLPDEFSKNLVQCTANAVSNYLQLTNN